MRSQMENVTICRECGGTGIARSHLRSVRDDPALGEEWYSLADDLCPRCNGEGRRVRKKSLAEQFRLPRLSLWGGPPAGYSPAYLVVASPAHLSGEAAQSG
jgi:hypothetical protein